MMTTIQHIQANQHPPEHHVCRPLRAMTPISLCTGLALHCLCPSRPNYRARRTDTGRPTPSLARDPHPCHHGCMAWAARHKALPALAVLPTVHIRPPSQSPAVRRARRLLLSSALCPFLPPSCTALTQRHVDVARSPPAPNYMSTSAYLRHTEV